jgi:hypothetical protein
MDASARKEGQQAASSPLRLIWSAPGAESASEEKGKSKGKPQSGRGRTALGPLTAEAARMHKLSGSVLRVQTPVVGALAPAAATMLAATLAGDRYGFCKHLALARSV